MEPPGFEIGDTVDTTAEPSWRGTVVAVFQMWREPESAAAGPWRVLVQDLDGVFRVFSPDQIEFPE